MAAAFSEGARAGELVFGPLEHSRVLGILHNPRYAGAFVFGQTRQRRVRWGTTSLPSSEA